MQISLKRSIAAASLLAVSACLSSAATAKQRESSGGQEIRDAGGGMFMEEVLPARPSTGTAPATRSRSPYRQPGVSGGQDLGLDLSNVGVNVDPSGNIIPLLNNGQPGGVQQQYSRTTVVREYPYPYFAGPAGGVAWGPMAPAYYPLPSQGFGVSIPVGRGASLNFGLPPGGWYPGWPGYFGSPWNTGWGQVVPQVPAWRYLNKPGNSPWITPYGSIPGTGIYWVSPFNGFSGGFSGGGYLWLPGVTEFQSTSTKRPLFTNPQ